ncbi:hypothetical protein DH2020_003485 [Rehmannia glutinosa]|uniref:glutathione transferase n=1 Tax=Rehmannia glutinosa TaxID=99300 RepID=A0ABR0XLX3_REHGL
MLVQKMAADEVKVLGSWSSPFVLRARIALNIKCVEYEFLEETFVSKSDLLLKSNPVYKKFPVFIHGGRPICESLIIVQYVDEVWASGPAILPSDPYDRPLHDSGLLILMIRAILMADGEEAKKAAALEEANKGLALLEDTFRKCSKGQKFFGGDKIGYLDIALGGFLVWVRVIQILRNVSLIDESKTPNLLKWAQHFSDDAAVKDVLPETQEAIGVC